MDGTVPWDSPRFASGFAWSPEMDASGKPADEPYPALQQQPRFGGEAIGSPSWRATKTTGNAG